MTAPTETPAPCPIRSVDLAIAKVARELDACLGSQAGTMHRLTERLDDLVRARAELIEQETSSWREWAS